MAKNDIYMKRWLSDKRRFADLINGSLFQGKQVFLPNHLKESNPEQTLILRKPNGENISVQRYRDIMMVAEDGTRIVVLACENQDEIHYAMPVRGMLYDALNYTEQISQIRKIRRENKELENSSEFLSGLKKNDRLTPVITVVFYYGEKEWDGAQDLHGLLGLNAKEYELLKKYIPNYRINLVDPRRMNNDLCFQTDLQLVFGMLEYRKSKEGLQKYMQTNKNYFGSMDENSYNAIRVLLGSGQQLPEAKLKSGGIDMCKALDDLYQDGVDEGIKTGIKRGMQQGIEQGIKAFILDYREEGYDKEKILMKLQTRFSLTREQSEEYFSRF
ncbi:Rpn family recombination-promoting nuclease/putative transposase [Faecalicatena orotica]|uniref:Rpn family recombination-promoting nuclease/putative transposase n=1 Tax=Faecalicatena orotica TaxID=1544 RepID=UPI0032177621